MTEQNYEYIETGRAPIKAWIKGVELEDQARQQLFNISQLPFIHKHVAAMPDTHWGRGATIGSVIATNKAIVPAAVGVDIGCGMMAVRTDLTSNDLPESLGHLRALIERKVPHGRTNNGQKGDRGAWDIIPNSVATEWKNLSAGYEAIVERHPKLQSKNTHNHLGTLGTGNHFVEVCVDESDRVWVMLHSGSRGGGNRIGTYFIEKAKREMEKYSINTYLPDQDLSYLVEHTEVFDDYVAAVGWAQNYARVNREIMMSRTLAAMRDLFRPFSTDKNAINCHHNYVERENHFGFNVWVTRKGAVRAREGDLGIIPGSMGAKSFIVRGKGNPDSFHSCSHGAGRKMSRGAAKKLFSVEDHIKATEGVECRKDASVIDETPGAYKDIDAVMAAQSDLISVEHTLKQIVCVKG